jgi:hypothetical protein
MLNREIARFRIGQRTRFGVGRLPIAAQGFRLTKGRRLGAGCRSGEQRFPRERLFTTTVDGVVAANHCTIRQANWSLQIVQIRVPLEAHLRPAAGRVTDTAK